jgi:hypothetical protein
LELDLSHRSMVIACMGPSWYSPCITHQHTVPIKYPIIRIFRHNPQWPSAKHRPGGRRAALASPGCGRYVPRPITAVIWQTGLHKGAACKNHLNATTAQRETIFMSNAPCSAARGPKGSSCPRASSSSWIGLGDTHTRALGAGLSCFAL